MHGRASAIIRFKDSKTAATYLKKTINYQGRKLNIQHYLKPLYASKRTNGADETQSNAKRQKTNNVPQATKNMKEEAAKMQVVESSSEEESSMSDEMTVEGGAAASTDSEDESIEEESSE